MHYTVRGAHFFVRVCHAIRVLIILSCSQFVDECCKEENVVGFHEVTSTRIQVYGYDASIKICYQSEKSFETTRNAYRDINDLRELIILSHSFDI